MRIAIRSGLLTAQAKFSTSTISKHSRLSRTTAHPKCTIARMLSFTLSNWSPSVQVSLPENLSRDQLLSFRPFKEWLETLKTSLHAQSEDSHAFHKDAYKLQSITVQAVDFFGSGSRIGFVKLTSKIANGNRETLPASILLRGGSVAMLVRHVQCSTHPRTNDIVRCYCSQTTPRHLQTNGTQSRQSNHGSQSAVWSFVSYRQEC